MYERFNPFSQGSGVLLRILDPQGKPYKIYKYNGEYLYHVEIAEKLLAAMQADNEAASSRIEKYTERSSHRRGRSLPEDMDANYGGASFPRHLQGLPEFDHEPPGPWFKMHPVQMHEISYGTLCQLFLISKGRQREESKFVRTVCTGASITPGSSGKGAHVALPPFPERRVSTQKSNPNRSNGCRSTADQGHRGDPGDSSTDLLVAQISSPQAIRSHGPA